MTIDRFISYRYSLDLQRRRILSAVRGCLSETEMLHISDRIVTITSPRPFAVSPSCARGAFFSTLTVVAFVWRIHSAELINRRLFLILPYSEAF